MQRSALALGMMLSCVIGMWGARLPADESAPAPAVKKPPGTTAEEGRRRWEQAFAHQLDMLRDQQARRRVPPQARNHEAILEAFRESVLPVRLGTVTVLDGDEQVALGTVVDREGLVLTKASELRGTPAIRLADGTRHAAEVVAVSEDHDLALLKIGRTDLEPVKWATVEPAVGSLLATAGSGKRPVAVGVVSVASRPIRSRVVLGVELRPAADMAIVDKVVPGSTAEKMGLRPDDVVTRVGDREIGTPRALVEILRDRQPGETVELAIRRGAETIELTARLEADGGLSPRRQGRLDRQNILAGDMSSRRGSFPEALQHDTVLQPEDCGGPLVNLDGEVVGVNISRAGRIESYALTPAVVLPVLEAMKAGQHPPPGNFPHVLEGRALDARIARQEKDLRAAERAQVAAERTRAEAEKLLEKARRQRREWAERTP